MRVKDLEGAALDWAVARIEGFPADTARFIDIFIYQNRTGQGYCYSRDWSLAGPIIEREDIALRPQAQSEGWFAHKVWGEQGESVGPTPLIAAMRCYVASKLGDEIEVPNFQGECDA